MFLYYLNSYYNIMSRTFNYYLELFDPSVFTTNDETFENDYKIVDYRNSGIQLQIPIFEHNLLARGNWYKLTTKQAKMTDRIDFCFSNLPVLQTKGIVNNRIFLDTDHFISDKMFYYDKFKNEEFCPKYITIEDLSKLDKTDSFFNSPLILKSGNGCSSEGIKVLKKYSEKEVYEHMQAWKKLKNWTLSQIYIPKLWNNIVVTNRIYYLVKRLRTKNKIVVSGYWYDEFISYRAKREFNGIDACDNQKKIFESLITNYDDTETPIDFFYTRTLNYDEYINIFTNEEYEIIKKKLSKYLNTITRNIFEHIVCANDYEENYYDKSDRNVTFHLYGLDTIITNDLDIKIIEINGSPTLRDFDEKFFNYKRLLNEILKLTIDTLYEPKYVPTCKGRGRFIQCGEFEKNLKIPVYFARSIYETYPFILKGFFTTNRSDKFQRIKNPNCSNIHLFYGKRDLYIRDQSSNTYYDEVLEWNKSKCAKNAKIINKIQGITYYLASKDNLYCQAAQFDFVPKSVLYGLGTPTKKLETFITEIKNENSNDSFIIKPVHGSQGKGITIIDSDDLESFMEEMNKAKDVYGYDKFIISKYIGNPKLCDNKKFNLRFYALICIKKMPTVQDESNDIRYYILKDVQVYFTMLPYDVQTKNIATEINKFSVSGNVSSKIASSISVPDLQKMIHMTNLQIVKDLSEKLNIKIPQYKFVNTLDKLGYDASYIKHITSQAHDMIDKTINLVKHDIRPINRFVKGSSAFNLIAYDTMVDDNDKLHLIEINRGPDLYGLKLTIGLDKITNIFSEIFNITVDDKTNDLTYFDEYKIQFN